MKRNGTSDQEVVLLERHGAVAHLTLNRPDFFNALNEEVCERLKTLMINLKKDDSVNAAVISGKGEAFCAGGDLDAIGQLCRVDPEIVYDRLKENFGVMNHLYHFPKPLIAAVHGPVVGGGCGVALVCDFIYADESAKFIFPFLDLGVSPDMGVLSLVVQKAGLPVARRLLLGQESLSAKEALRANIADKIIENGNYLDAALETARKLAEKSPLAIRLTKDRLNRCSHLSFSEALDLETQHQSILFAGSHARTRTVKILEGFIKKKDRK